MMPMVCEPACGDGVTVADEECDKGKDNNDSKYGGCSTKCKWGSFCRDGIVNAPDEECDDGPKNGTQYGSGCTLGCTKAHFCGDGIVDTNRGEQCDLGKDNGGDLCSDTCKIFSLY
jgi:cysteine-rich repeat protein